MSLQIMLHHTYSTVPPLRRAFAQLATANSGKLPEGFILFPDFFNICDQRILLTTALNQLDALESKRIRKIQKELRTRNPPPANSSLENTFLPEHCYSFQEGHYDNVIRDYREMHLSSWPESEVHGLTSILDRLRALYPSQNTQTHLLHLSSTGEILPHVDNFSASGAWILGVSLGATRVLRMESMDTAAPDRFETILPSGSVYLQRDDIRYKWKHAVLHLRDSGEVNHGQRVSIMVRDRKEDSTNTVAY
ncbi:hypothetical protein HYDPIDRAFT_24412 [Hydnomerulius pinastri MD-312]|nr:hypothetical protein HYDPIDRAFT_24412 [Hydnomerulius pinastri MD-312]